MAERPWWLRLDGTPPSMARRDDPNRWDYRHPALGALLPAVPWLTLWPLLQAVLARASVGFIVLSTIGLSAFSWLLRYSWLRRHWRRS